MCRQLLVDLLRQCEQPLRELALDELLRVDLERERLLLAPERPLPGDLRARRLRLRTVAPAPHRRAARRNAVKLVRLELVQRTDVPCTENGQ